jgi:Lipase (class 3)
VNESNHQGSFNHLLSKAEHKMASNNRRTLSAVLLLSVCVHNCSSQTLRRRANQCKENDTISLDEKDQLSLTFSKAFVKRAVIASELSYIVFEDDISSKQKVKHYNEIYDEFSAWYDGKDDAHLLVKQDGVCYGVFRGTFQPNFLDQFQNVNPIPMRVEGTQCDVRKGFYQAHYGTPYIDNFRQATRKCVQSCPKEKCPLILTGQSQGASISIAATLDPALQKYNPTTLAFGPLTTLVSSCPTKYLHPDNVYVFINVGSGIYDDVPYSFPYGRHFGHVILHLGLTSA